MLRDEAPYPITYAGTKAFDADSDGDGVLDGADDQDFDDVPNIMELSRSMAGDRAIQALRRPAVPRPDVGAPATTWVNPFNPCLPDANSRTCMRHPVIGVPFPPFDADWKRVRPELATRRPVLSQGPHRVRALARSQAVVAARSSVTSSCGPRASVCSTTQ